MAPRFQQCLHRAIIDTSLLNRVARKFWKTGNNGFSREQNSYSAVYQFLIKTLLSLGVRDRRRYLFLSYSTNSNSTGTLM